MASDDTLPPPSATPGFLRTLSRHPASEFEETLSTFSVTSASFIPKDETAWLIEQSTAQRGHYRYLPEPSGDVNVDVNVEEDGAGAGEVSLPLLDRQGDDEVLEVRDDDEDEEEADEVKQDDDEEEHEEEQEAPAKSAFDAFSKREWHALSTVPSRRVFVVDADFYAKVWFERDLEHVLEHSEWRSSFALYAGLLVQGRAKDVCRLALSREVEADVLPVYLDDTTMLQLRGLGLENGGEVGEDEQLRLWASSLNGVFAESNWRHTSALDKEVVVFDRVLQKRQLPGPEFATEIATVMSTLRGQMRDAAVLPSPRLLAIHHSSKPNVAVSVYEQCGEHAVPADEFFGLRADSARGQVREWNNAELLLRTKLLCSAMFAFCLKCCHGRGIVVNDVGLHNFLTNGETCFQIFNFHLSVVAHHDNPAVEQAVPYPHDKISVFAAPETRTVSGAQPRSLCSGASDVYQFGWMLHQLFSHGNPNVPRCLLEEQGVDLADAWPCPDPPADLAAYPAEVYSLVVLCLSKEPADRPGISEVTLRLAQAMCDAFHSHSFEERGLGDDALQRLRMSLDALPTVLSESTSVSNAFVRALERAEPALEVANLFTHSVPESALPCTMELYTSATIGGLGEYSDFSRVLGPDGGRLACVLLRTPVSKINLASHRLGDEGLDHIVAARNAGFGGDLSELNLRDNSLTTASLVPLFAVLPQFGSLTKLTLSENALGDEGVMRLAEAFVQVYCYVEQLDLSNNNLTDASIAGVRSMLQHSARLWLFLHLNGFSQPAKDTLIEAFGGRALF